MPSAKKLVITILLLTALIIAWPFVGILLDDKDIMNKAWFIVIWIILFILPFIVIPAMLSGTVKSSGILNYGRRLKKMMETGRPAEAILVSISESKSGFISINDQPFVSLELEIHDGDKEPYNVTVGTVISRLAVHQYQPGIKIPVLIDPKDPMNVVVNPQGSIKPTVYGNVSDDVKNYEVEAYGKDGRAKILAVKDTGKSKNFMPVVLLTMEVSAPDIEPYTFDKEIPLPTFVVQKLKPGMTVNAKIHPDDRTKVMLMNIM